MSNLNDDNEEEKLDMIAKKIVRRSFYDRRTGFDRRKATNQDYCKNDGVERRMTAKDHRISGERRSGWARDTRSSCGRPGVRATTA